MFLPVKAILDRRPRKDGTAAIYIQYCFSSDRRILLSTDLAVPPAHWNKRLLRISPSLPKSFGDAEILNGRLQKMLRTAEDMISYTLEQKMADPIAFLKKAWHPEFKTADLDFYKYIRITPEEAGKKIQQIWERRGEMQMQGTS